MMPGQPTGARAANGRPPLPSPVRPSLTLDLDGLVEQVAQRTAELLAERTPVDADAAPAYLSVEEAAEYLACPRSRIYDLVSRREVRHFRDGRRLLFRRLDLDDALTPEEARP